MKNKVFLSLLLLGSMVLSGCSLPGTTGAPGPQGEQGIPGEVGPQGPQGPQGDKGDKGEQGEPGTPGQNGADGEKGDTGPAGPQGPQGDKGDTGDAGPQGPQGAQGPQGEKGDKGDPGKDGQDGAQGPQGEKGDKGDQGLPGKDGVDGKPGQDGAQGPQGEKGDKGDAGTPGKDGADGAPGKDGQDGLDGVDGKSTYQMYVDKYGYQGSEDDFLYDFAHHHLGTKNTYTITIAEYLAGSSDYNKPTKVKEIVPSKTYKNGEKINIPQRNLKYGEFLVAGYDGNVDTLSYDTEYHRPDDIEMFDVNNYRAYKDATIVLIYDYYAIRADIVCDFDVQYSYDIPKNSDFKLKYYLGAECVSGYRKEISDEEQKLVDVISADNDLLSYYNYDKETQTFKNVRSCPHYLTGSNIIFTYGNICTSIYFSFGENRTCSNYYFSFTQKQNLLNIGLHDAVYLYITGIKENNSGEENIQISQDNGFNFALKNNSNILTASKEYLTYATKIGEDDLLVYKDDKIVAQTHIVIKEKAGEPVKYDLRLNLDSYISDIVDPNVKLNYHINLHNREELIENEQIISVYRNGVDIINNLREYVNIDTAQNTLLFKQEGLYRFVFADGNREVFTKEKTINVNKNPTLHLFSIRMTRIDDYYNVLKETKYYTGDYNPETDVITNEKPVQKEHEIIGKFLIIKFVTKPFYKVSSVFENPDNGMSSRKQLKEVEENVFVLDIKEGGYGDIIIKTDRSAERARIYLNSNITNEFFTQCSYEDETGEIFEYSFNNDVYSGGILTINLSLYEGIEFDNITTDKGEILSSNNKTITLKVSVGGDYHLNLTLRRTSPAGKININIPYYLSYEVIARESTGRGTYLKDGNAVTVGRRVNISIRPNLLYRIASIKVNGIDITKDASFKVDSAKDYNIEVIIQDTEIARRTVVFKNINSNLSKYTFVCKAWQVNNDYEREIFFGLYDSIAGTYTVVLPESYIKCQIVGSNFNHQYRHNTTESAEYTIKKDVFEIVIQDDDWIYY